MNWVCPNGPLGYLRLYAQLLPANFKNFWQVPNLLLQKLPIEVFTAITKLTFTPRTEGERRVVVGLPIGRAAVARDVDFDASPRTGLPQAADVKSFVSIDNQAFQAQLGH